jgi:Protein of unknown function (DUF1553)/Protein of unknown function (DUF1549)
MAVHSHLRMFALALLVCGATLETAEARPAHKQALIQYFGSYLPKKLNDCRTCHLPDEPGAKNEADKPHNVFGARLKSVRAELRKAGKANTIENRLDTILAEDSDSDGVSNLLEILTGHFPGDAADKPTAADLAESKKLLAAFAKFRASYPWRPFEVVKRPAPPQVKNAGWVRNPIDAFVAAAHDEQGLKPRPQAPPSMLLRRLYLDLTGLPPTPEEQRSFRDDKSPDAYEKVVDRLLASPRYGERWGRHWMDVWRYSDWAGYGPQVRDSQPHIWHWRDWIIDSLNDDKGYDRMVLEMLAGDELAPEDPQALAGTGYLVRNYKLLSREKCLQDTVDHTTMAFLGITMACAKCHDHMFDPFLQKEYYQLRAIFEPHQVRTDTLPGEPDIKKNGLPRVYDADLKAPTYFYVRGDDRTPDKSKSMPPGVPEVIAGHFGDIKSVNLPASALAPEKRDFVIKEMLKASAAARDQALAKWKNMAPFSAAEPNPGTLIILEKDLAAAKHVALEAVLQAEKLEDTGKTNSAGWKEAALTASKVQRQIAVLEAKHKLVSAELKIPPPKSKKFDPEKAVADAKKALEKAEADAKQPVTTNYMKRVVKTYPAQSSGRRLAFARWIADKDNPLTARVAVNHIWLRHFGQALVPTVFDFGANGRPPSHPALLDWLAAEFMQPSMANRAAPWSMKHIHRLIVTSNTYRLASTPDQANAAVDRDNKYLWRMTPRRLEAEAVRDSIFHVAGKLDLTMRGPDIDYPQALTVPRRTVYFRHAAEKESVWMQIFDGPSVTECYERKPSIVPQQALALVNSEMTLKNSRILARKLKANDAAAFTVAAFSHVLSRPPTAAELKECTMFLEEQTKRLRESKIASPGNDADGRLPSPDPAMRARENLVHALMNHHEFVTIR